MIYLEKTVNQILREEGQVIVTLSALQITWEDLQDLFVGVYNEAKDYITIYDWVNDTLGNDPQKRDYAHIKHMSYSNALYMQKMMTTVAGEQYDYNPHKKEATSLVNADFSLEVQAYPTLDYLPYSITLNLKANRQYPFILPCSFEPETFEFAGMEAFYDTNNPNKIIIQSDNGVGSFDNKTLHGTIIMDQDYTGTLSVTSKYLGIKELDLNCELFYTWFKGSVMCYIGAMKRQMDLTGIGLPFDINADGLLDRGRQLLDKVEDLKGTKSHWSNF